MKSIFVSSTFRDMNFERDILNKSISPKLNYYLSANNQSLRILDLRWGVDTSDMDEEKASQKVLDVCFGELENCKPYIIILLGDRYGYIPNNNDISITHMEILKGAIESAQKEHVFIYFRNADYSEMPEDVKKIYIEQDSVSKNKLNSLKNELKKLMPERCFEYSSHWSQEKQQLVSDEFEQSVFQKLKYEFVESYDDVTYRSPLQKQFLENEEILCDNLKYAYQNEDVLSIAVESAKNGDLPYGFIGDGGSGKSIFLSLLCSALRKNGQNVNILFCGDNQFSSYVRNAAEYVFYTLTISAGLSYDFEKFAKFEYNELLNETIKIKDLVKEKGFVILDAVDKCDKGMVEYILWCYRFLSDQIRIIFSSRDSAEIMRAEKSLELAEIKYDKTDLSYIAIGLLNQHGKSINKNLIDLICEKAESPLHLKIMLTRLLNLNASDFSKIQTLGGGMDAINEYLKSLINKMPSDTQDSVENYLVAQSDDDRATGFFAFLLNFICFSSYGLQENDLQEIFALTGHPWIEIDYIDFLSIYSLFIRTRDNGRIDISHDIIRYTLRELFSEQKHMVCTIMADYFLNKQHPDAYSIRSFFDVAHIGGCHGALIDFSLKYYKTFQSFEMENQLINDEIEKCLIRDFLSDGGEFLSGVPQYARTPDELLIFHSVLSNSLTSKNDYLSEEEVFSILKGCMNIPLSYDFFPIELMYMDIDSCRQFARQHNAKSDKIEALFEQFKQVIKKREGKDNFALTETVNSDDASKMVDFLNDSTMDIPDKNVILYKLSQKIEEMSKRTETANETISLCFKVIDAIDNLEFERENKISTLAQIYSCLGEAYKSLECWEESLKYDTMSLELYEEQYNLTPSGHIFRKYRERVLNVAISIEQHAIVKETDKSLWEKARKFYEKFYNLNLLAIASGIPEKELFRCSLSIFSYGTALIKTGNLAQGLEKYREAIKIITDLLQSNLRPDLLYNLILHILDGVYVLINKKEYAVAAEYCGELKSHISDIIKIENKEYTDKLLNDFAAFVKNLVDLTNNLSANDNIDGAIGVSQIIYSAYIMFLPIAPMGLKARLVITGKDIGDFYYKKGDYDGAVKQYIALINLISEEKLCIKEDNGKYVDNVNLLLIDAFIYIILCFDKLGKVNEANAIIQKLTAWSEYIADHSEVARGDSPRVLYTIAAELARDGCGAAHVIMTLALYATRKDGYDIKEHNDTVQLIHNALFNQNNS